MHIGLGTAAVGRPQYINIRTGGNAAPFDKDRFRKQGIQLLEAAYQQGIRYFDTAPGYGMAEQMIHDWQKENPHPDLEIATKWGYEYTANFDPEAVQHERKEHSLDLLNRQWAKSQELLPRISVLQIHSATFQTGVLKNQAVLERLAEIKEEQKVRIGITTSGDNQADVMKFALDIHFNNKPLFNSYQVTYNILDQNLNELLNSLSDQRIVIKEALANGRLFRQDRYPHYHDLYDTMERIAHAHQVGVDAVALRFCLDTLNPFMVLSGASQVQQVQENLKAHTFQLSRGEVEELKSHAVDPKAYWSERKQLEWN